MGRDYRLIDVINETGASFAQIRRWRHRGLLPGVVPRGRYTTYSQDYVDRVRHILAIYEQNMTADDIRDRLHSELDP